MITAKLAELLSLCGRRSSAWQLGQYLGSSVDQSSLQAQHHSSAARYECQPGTMARHGQAILGPRPQHPQATALELEWAAILLLESEWAAIYLLEIQRALTDMGGHLWR
ncbi:hypothetical protein AAC387_Pa07g0080 [Persea americana]